MCFIELGSLIVLCLLHDGKVNNIVWALVFISWILVL